MLNWVENNHEMLGFSHKLRRQLQRGQQQLLTVTQLRPMVALEGWLREQLSLTLLSTAQHHILQDPTLSLTQHLLLI